MILYTGIHGNNKNENEKKKEIEDNVLCYLCTHNRSIKIAECICI